MGWFGALTGAKEGQPIQSVLPIVIVHPLRLDYQVFLVSRSRPTSAGIRHPRQSSSIWTQQRAAAAAIIMSVFGFGLPVVTIASLAVALASGVIFDAFVVRMIIVPAALKLLDQKAWWIPSWLDRIIPHIDTEGRTLEAEAQ
ncbi:MAG: MMPL family transporter [Thermomicrobiales bacterium]